MDKALPKTDTFRFRINPEVKEQVEDIFEKNGLTLTQAINIFIQQSINVGGLPFIVSEDNAEIIKEYAYKRLIKELEYGEKSGEGIPFSEAKKMMGIE